MNCRSRMSRFPAWYLVCLVVTCFTFPQSWVRSIDIPFIATDRSGRLDLEVGPHDLTIFDGEKKQQITSLKSAFDNPLRIALVLDRSRSVAEALPAFRTAAVKFLQSILRPEKDKACVVAFDNHVYLLQDWTDDVDLLAAGIEQLSAAGGTSLFDALYKTLRDQFSEDPQDSTTRVLLLLTDGEDTTSHASLWEVRDQIAASKTLVYALRTDPDQSLNPPGFRGKEVLSELREVAGGEMMSLTVNPKDLDRQFRQIERELRNLYTLTFTSHEPPDGRFHEVRIKPTRKDLVIKPLKDGYYSTQ